MLASWQIFPRYPRTIDFQAVFAPNNKVVVSVSGRGVNQSCSGFASFLSVARFGNVNFGFRVRFAAQSNVVAVHHERFAFNPRMLRFHSVEFRAFEFRQNARHLPFAVIV